MYACNKKNRMSVKCTGMPLRSTPRWIHSFEQALWWMFPTQQHLTEPIISAERKARCKISHSTDFHDVRRKEWNVSGRSKCSANLFEAPLDAAVLTGHHFAFPVVCSSAGHAQVGVALSHGQVAGTLFGVALSLTSAAREAVLACRTFRHEEDDRWRLRTNCVQ